MKRIILVVALVIVPGLTAHAWSFHTHRKITADALRLMPTAFKTEFAAYRQDFLQGSTDPDMVIKDFANHAYHPDGSHTAGLYRIEELFNETIKMIKAKRSAKDIAYQLGLLSHYVADLNQPLHTAGRERDPNESVYHVKYERDLNPWLSLYKLPVMHYRPVSVVKDRVVQMTTEALRYYDQIKDAYTGGDRYPAVAAMSEKQVAVSTGAVIDFWLGAFKAAGRTFSETSSASSSPASAIIGDSININSATAAELSRFFNISAARATRIVNARPFKSIYALAKLDGFNVGFVKRNRKRIRLN